MENNSHETIITDIIYDIIEGKLKPGDKLPPERTYIEKYNLSRMTVRKAFDKLKSLDIINSIERQGNFINKKAITATNSNDFILGYSLTAILKGLKPSSKVLNFEIIKCSESIASILKVNPGSDVYFIKRIRYLNDMPSAIEISYIPTFELPNLTIKDLEKSLYENLYKTHSLLIKTKSINIEAIYPSHDLIKTLHLKDKEAVFSIAQISKIHNRNNFEYVLSFQAGSRINI